MDIVIVGQQPWDVQIGSNCKNIALELSKHNRVLYVNSPLDRITSIRNRKNPETRKRLRIIRKQETGLIKIKSDLWTLYPDCLVESVNWIANTKIFDALNKRNGRKFSDAIRRSLTELGFSDIILFNDNEIIKCFYLKEFLNPSLSVYYSRDFILATDYWKKRGTRLEPMVIAEADLCVANSVYLKEYCASYNPESYYIGQGCELEIFKKDDFEKPNELGDLKGPIIGYVGAILSMRLDLEIIGHIAVTHPEWNIVLVGPEDETFAASKLHQLSSIRFLGSREASLLPAYISSFDVCINPQALNQLTIGNYPRKVDEYLAMGKPVVATKTRAMESFRDHVYLATNKEEFVELISHALESDSKELSNARKEFAASHTWENSVNKLSEAIVARINKNTSIKLLSTHAH